MNKTSSLLQVKSIKLSNHQKIVSVVSQLESAKLILPRFSAVSKDDLLHVDGIKTQKISLESKDEPGIKIPILPTYCVDKKYKLGAQKSALRICEITTEEEYQAYMELERFHYRSSPSLIEQEEDTSKGSGGRKAVLLASLDFGKQRKFVGYIELSMPLMMVAPRHAALARPFRHTKRAISWSKWDQNSLRQNLNLIVRIARLVIHPTFRGIGLSHTLIEESEKFAKERWHIGSRKPIMIEISAEMLNYFDFVSGCGFIYCGHTDGNYKRVAKDMRQMIKGQKISSGIMTLQNKYLEGLRAYAKKNNLSDEEAIKSVEKIAESDDPESQVDEESWLLLRKIFRPPRPYFIKGLDIDTKRYLKNVAKRKESNIVNLGTKYNPSITIEELEVKADITLPKSKNVGVIKDAFGLEGSQVKQTLLKVNEFRATQGNIFLLVGASGTGKSIYLDVLGMNDRQIHPNISVTHTKFDVPRTAKFEDIDPESIVIDYFANKYGLAASLRTLAVVGLSEALPLVKPFWMLSKGQKYRALLAELMLQKTEIWLLDEFGADLDPITANVLAHKLRAIADSTGVIVFVAAANNGHFFQSLRPSRVISFDLGIQPQIKTVTEYKNELL